MSVTAKHDLTRPGHVTRHHPRIGEFLERLAGPEGLNLRKQFDLDAAHVGRCSGALQFHSVKRTLAKMEFNQVAIEQCLLYFRANNLTCDCAVLAGILDVEGPYEYDIGEYRRVIDIQNGNSRS